MLANTYTVPPLASFRDGTLHLPRVLVVVAVADSAAAPHHPSCPILRLDVRACITVKAAAKASGGRTAAEMPLKALLKVELRQQI